MVSTLSHSLHIKTTIITKMMITTTIKIIMTFMR